ncbi:hypothetical protein [Klebsiella aerogenes EA1509E]|nr:hypothetical protein [Klebsiella aerogenes EA1509E]
MATVPQSVEDDGSFSSSLSNLISSQKLKYALYRLALVHITY